MNQSKKVRLNVKAVLFPSIILFLMLAALAAGCTGEDFFSGLFMKTSAPSSKDQDDFIKWVDFNASYQALEKAMQLDIQTYGSEVHIDWTDTLAYLSCKYGNNFKLYKAKDIDALAEKLKGGQTLSSLCADMKFFDYYKECYEAVLGEFLGEHKVQTDAQDDGERADGGKKVWVEKYGLKVFSPIAEGFWYESYDDFGVSRSYGYKRRHLGHDMMIGIGAPVVAVESGIVEALGWNQYGGWRIGIRSLDKKRYYYYAHLRKDSPYAAGLYEGKAVNAGDVIGYTGQTGYSTKENVNNINSPHLHFGMQLIFDESQREGSSEIWIDVYNICKLLAKNKSAVIRDDATKEYNRKYNFSEPSYFLKNSVIYANADPAPPPDGSVAVPIIMYHSLLKSADGQNNFIINPKSLEDDMKYLKEKGYTPIVIKDLHDYVYDGVPLPEKPVMLTFDDGHYNNYHYAFPLLKEYGMKAVISVVGCLTDTASELDENNPSYSYLTWEQIGEMSKSGYFEIQNHSDNLHNYSSGRCGAAKKEGESRDDYEDVLLSDVSIMQHKIAKATGSYPLCFTYPFGQVSPESTQILKDAGFHVTLGCRSGVNYIMPDDEDQLFNLRRNLRPVNMSSQAFFKDICP